jgi:hypothetical protein
MGGSNAHSFLPIIDSDTCCESNTIVSIWIQVIAILRSPIVPAHPAAAPRPTSPRARSSAEPSGGLWRAGTPDDTRRGTPGRPARVSQVVLPLPTVLALDFRLRFLHFNILGLSRRGEHYRPSRSVQRCSCCVSRSEIRNPKDPEREHSLGAMHCEWPVLVDLVRCGGQSQGRPRGLPDRGRRRVRCAWSSFVSRGPSLDKARAAGARPSPRATGRVTTVPDRGAARCAAHGHRSLAEVHR